MRLGLVIVLGLMIGVVLSAELILAETVPTISHNKPTKKRFIPFVIPANKKNSSNSKEQQVQEGSFINVPTRCPPNTLMVGQRCRTVF